MVNSFPTVTTSIVMQFPLGIFLSLLNLSQRCLCFGFFGPRGMWDLISPTRDGTHIPCIGRQSLNHWTAREVPTSWYLKSHYPKIMACSFFFFNPNLLFASKTCRVTVGSPVWIPDAEDSNQDSSVLTGSCLVHRWSTLLLTDSLFPSLGWYVGFCRCLEAPPIWIQL